MKIIGYDPGGNHHHGVALLSVRNGDGGWIPDGLELHTCGNAQDVIDLIADKVPEGDLLGAGIDTLTVWSTKSAGWRPADLALREKYKFVARSIDNANHINGSMCLNGALLLKHLFRRADRGGKVTEAHPKVLFYALKNQRHPWTSVGEAAPAIREDAARWLLGEIGISEGAGDWIASLAACDHQFDALLGALAAWKGVNGVWSVDLHAFANVVHPFGEGHYWWPDEIS